jgi:GTPase SAR1 family protein
LIKFLDKESFKHITTHWLDQIKDIKRNDAIFALVGNKSDLSDKREVTKDEGVTFAKDKKFIFHEVSALSGENINSLFYKDIFDQIVNQFRVSMDDHEESKIFYKNFLLQRNIIIFSLRLIKKTLRNKRSVADNIF